MRLVNFRYVCQPRRLKFFVVSLLILGVFLNLSILFVKQKPGTQQQLTERLTKPWRFIKGILFTSLKTNATCRTKLKFLILVSSNVGNFDRRSLIRKTWGPDYSLMVRWQTVFLLSTNDNNGEMNQLSVEENVYGDIIRGDYKEAFSNMAFKVAMGFEWAIKYCQFDYLLKADDDTFVNTRGLLKYFESAPREKLYTGNPMIGSPVLRNGRYAVEYDKGDGRDDRLNKTFFAPYCSGGGFVLSKDVVDLILDRFDFDHPLNIDDAYIGELAERAHVKLVVNSKNFLMYADKCLYSVEAFVQHPAKYKCLEDLYEQQTKYLATGELRKPPTKPPTQPPKTAPKNTPNTTKNSKKIQATKLPTVHTQPSKTAK